MKIKLPARIGLVRLSLIAIVVGLITGFGAVLFRALIGLVYNIAFLGLFAFKHDASVFTPPSPRGAAVVLVPVVGGVLVTFLITNFAPEARGHGMPEVMDAIYYKEGVIARSAISRWHERMTSCSTSCSVWRGATQAWPLSRQTIAVGVPRRSSASSPRSMLPIQVPKALSPSADCDECLATCRSN